MSANEISEVADYSVSSLTHLGASWEIKLPFERVEDDASLNLTFKVTNGIHTAMEDDWYAAVRAQAKIEIFVDTSGNQDSDQELLVVRSATKFRAGVTSSVKNLTEDDVGTIQRSVLSRIYPHLVMSVLEGVRLAGYPEPDLPLTYEEYRSSITEPEDGEHEDK